MNDLQPITCLDPADEPMLSPQARRFWNSFNDQLEIHSREDGVRSPSTNNPCVSPHAVVSSAAEPQDFRLRRLSAIHPRNILDVG